MSEWIVYSKDGLTERCRLKKLEYAGSYMNERTVTATFEYHSEVAFEVFDYIVYRGEKFELEAIPSVKKTSKYHYTYELRFVSLKYELERCEMRDIVPNDNGATYPSPLSFSFTGSVRHLAERVQANLDSLYGKDVWAISVSSDATNEEKNITISQQNCWNALSLVNTSYGLDFSIKGRSITIGGKQSAINHVFKYGKGNGLYEIERVADNGTGIVTKLRAYGSTRNLDYSYPKKPEWIDSVLPVSFILSPLRLMLPSFKLDGKTDYIMANDSVVEEYGIRESSMIYEDIYPTITGAENSNGDSIDEIMAVEEVNDSSPTFVIHLYDLGFDLESHLTTEDAQISMKSGAMQGYTFNISKIEKQEDNTYKVTLGRITTDSSNTGNYDIPNSKWGMSAGDKFVLLNILMPQEYIRAAEQRLLVRAQEYLAEYGKTNFSYNIGLNDKFLKEHENIYDELIEGSKLSVYDEELGIREEVTIQSITIDDYMEDNILPQVKVTLNNKPSASTLERIQGKINELSDSASNSFSTQTELLQQYRKKLDKPFFDRLFAAVDKDGKEIPSTDLSTPISYIKARFSLASLGGLTMYLDDKSFNLPTIYDGLPIDSQTIYWEDIKDDSGVVIGKILKAKTGGGTLGSLTNVGEWADSVADVDRIMVQKKGSDTWEAMDVSGIGSASFENISESGEGNAYTSFELSEDKKSLTLVKGETFALASDLEDKWTTDEELINNWNTAFGWGDHSKAGYAAKSYVDSTFVTIAGNEDVTGIHNFTNGLKIGGKLIDKTKDDVIYIDANLVVRGGITMYGDRDANVPSILNSIPTAGYDDIQARGLIAFNSNHFVINNGVVSAIQGSAGLDVEQLDNYLKNNHYATEDWVRDYVLENASGGIESITKQMVIDALGYTPYSAENPNGYITAASIPSALKNPYALTFGSKTYDGSAAKSITASDLGAALSSDLSKYLPLSGGTLTNSGYQVLSITRATTANDYGIALNFSNSNGTACNLVAHGNTHHFKRAYDGINYTIWDSGNDGSGSGLDADTLDGKHLSDILASNVASANGLSVQAVTTDDFSKYIGAYWALGLSVLTNTSGAAVGNIGATYTVLNIGGNNMNRFGRFLFNRADDSSQLYWQTTNTTVTAWGAMRQVAFVDSNVASATYATTAGNAEKFAGYELTRFLLMTGRDYTEMDLNTIGYYQSIFTEIRTIEVTTTNSPHKGYGALLSLKDRNGFAKMQFLGSSDSSVLYFRSQQKAGESITSAWKTIAFTDSNVASATKLATARTIWGQSFDGSGDVSGTITVGYSLADTPAIQFSKGEYIDGHGNIYFSENSGGWNFFDKNKTTLFRLTKDGSVLMGGRTTDDYKGVLQINTASTRNAISLYDTSRPETSIMYTGNDGYTWIVGKGIGSTGDAFGVYRAGVKFLINSSGNVGIGTTNPTCALDVNGSISVSADANITGDLRLKGSGNYGNTLYFGDGSYCYITEPSDDAMEIYGSKGVTIDGGVTYGLSVVSMASFTDNVGIGTDEPSYKLHVVGSAYISSNLLTGGGITMYSQRSLKNVVDERGLSLSELSAIKPTRYTWKDGRDSRLHFGGIADDIQQVLPEVVYKTKEGVLTMDYGNAGFAIAASLIKPVVDHEEKISQLQKRVSELEQELNRLRA